MLVKTDSNQVPIQATELVERTRFEGIKAEKDHLRREARPLTPDRAGMDVSDPGQRAGRPMSGWTLQQKLQRIAPFLVFERSNNDPSKTGIYVLSARIDPSLHRGNLIFVCGMETGITPEFSIIEAEAHTVPDPEAVGGNRIELGMAREIRGWRSVLAVLLKRRLITTSEIERHFQITLGRDSERWQDLLAGRPEIFSDTVEDTHGIEDAIDRGSTGDGNPSEPTDGAVHNGTADGADPGDSQAG